MDIQFPPFLQKGDKVVIVLPSSKIDQQFLKGAKKRMESWMITWLPALLRIVGRIINGIMNVNAIKECRLLCDFQMRKVCYSEIKQEANRVRRVTL